MTYPDPEVRSFLTDRFALVQVSYADRAEPARDLIRLYRLLWSPGFVVLDPARQEVRRFLGFQRPREFLAELQLGLGKVDLLHRRNADALDLFRAVADLDPPAPVSAEALYWAGIAAYYRDKRDLAFLRDYWKELEQRFPESRWWTHADVWK